MRMGYLAVPSRHAGFFIGRVRFRPRILGNCLASLHGCILIFGVWLDSAVIVGSLHFTLDHGDNSIGLLQQQVALLPH